MPDAAPAAPAGGAAPAAPVSAPAVGPGTQAGGGGQSPAPAKGAARGNDGRFLPADGNVGAEPKEPVEGQPPEGEQPPKKEPYRLKRKVKVYGEEQELDLDEDSAAREIARGRAALKKLADAEKYGRAGRELFELAKKDPEALLRHLEIDPEQWVQQRVATAAQRAAMSPEERRAAEAEAERDSYKAKLEQIAQAHQQAKQETELEQHREAAIQRYGSALKEAGLGMTHLNVFYMAEVEKQGMQDGVEYSPRELALETKRRMGEITSQHLNGLDDDALMRELGPERVKRLLKKSITDFERRAGRIPGVATAPPPPAPPGQGAPEYLNESEVKRQLREWTNGGR